MARPSLTSGASLSTLLPCSTNLRGISPLRQDGHRSAPSNPSGFAGCPAADPLMIRQRSFGMALRQALSVNKVSIVLARFGKQTLELSLWHAIQTIGAHFQPSAIKNGYAAACR